MNDQDLKRLNRNHDAETALKALENALAELSGKSCSVSIDLMFGRPGQTLKDWNDELHTICQNFPTLKHMSLYQLTVERGTQLWKDVNANLVKMPNEDVQADMYDLAVEKLSQFGLQRYEVSNFACDYDSQSKHNKSYWNGNDYIGIGPGAHSRFFPPMDDALSQEIAAYVLRGNNPPAVRSGNNYRHARVQTLEPEAWMREVEVVSHATRKIDYLSNEDVLSELLATSLRTNVGLTEDLWLSKINEITFDSRNYNKDESINFALKYIVENDEKCQRFLQNGTVIVDGENNLRMSQNGLKYLDHVLPYLLSSLHKHMSKLVQS